MSEDSNLEQDSDLEQERRKKFLRHYWERESTRFEFLSFSACFKFSEVQDQETPPKIIQASKRILGIPATHSGSGALGPPLLTLFLTMLAEAWDIDPAFIFEEDSNGEIIQSEGLSGPV